MDFLFWSSFSSNVAVKALMRFDLESACRWVDLKLGEGWGVKLEYFEKTPDIEPKNVDHISSGTWLLLVKISPCPPTLVILCLVRVRWLKPKCICTWKKKLVVEYGRITAWWKLRMPCKFWDVVALWQAQFYIFEKVKSEMRLAAQDEVHLRSEVVVPKATIGRIIGKGGQNVSGLEPIMLATLHLCECFYLFRLCVLYFLQVEGLESVIPSDGAY